MNLRRGGAAGPSERNGRMPKPNHLPSQSLFILNQSRFHTLDGSENIFDLLTIKAVAVPSAQHSRIYDFCYGLFFFFNRLSADNNNCRRRFPAAEDYFVSVVSKNADLP